MILASLRNPVGFMDRCICVCLCVCMFIHTYMQQESTHTCFLLVVVTAATVMPYFCFSDWEQEFGNIKKVITNWISSRSSLEKC